MTDQNNTRARFEAWFKESGFNWTSDESTCWLTWSAALTFSKDDVEKACAAVAQEMFNSHKPESRPLAECSEDIAQAVLRSIGANVEE